MPAQVVIRPQSLLSLIREMHEKGAIRIPRFQRDYVWERTRVAQLLDSVYRGFPIGSFFFWITPREYRDLYRELPELSLPNPADYEQIKMILDGQQRLTSLFVVAYGLVIKTEGKSEKDYKKICFDLDREEFFVAPRGEDRSHTLSVWRFFDAAGDTEIYDNLSPERRLIFTKCKNSFSSYPLSIVEAEGIDLNDAVSIFERINQGGKKLNLFDLVVASTWSVDFDLKERVKEANKLFDGSGFGSIDYEIYAQLLALVVTGQCTKQSQLQLKNEEIKNIWTDVVESVKLAVDFLRKNLGVEIYEFVPYPALITMVAYLYYKVPGRALDARQSDFVKSWFWRASLSQRYASSTLTAMGDDRKEYFDPAVNGEIVQPDYPVSITVKDIQELKMYTRSALKNAILCLLAMRKPLHFGNGSVVTLDRSLCSSFNDSQKHHIFPNAFLRDSGIKTRHLVANFAFIPSELNNAISDKRPSQYFMTYGRNTEDDLILYSHIIPSGSDSGIWTDDFDTFLVQRSELIFSALQKIAGFADPIEVLSEEDPNEAVNRFEIKMRDFLSYHLEIKYEGDYWRRAVPGPVKDSVEKRIESFNENHPGLEKTWTPRERLNYLDFSDYSRIIFANWDIFQNYFGKKETCGMHLDHLMDFRNLEKHVREKDSVTRKMGEAALVWLSRIIDKTASGAGEVAVIMGSVNSENNNKYYCRFDGNIVAEGRIIGDNSFPVLKGSRAAAQVAPSFLEHRYNILRETLLKGEILQEEDGVLKFAKDYTFSSPSAAAAIVLGRSANGRSEWRDRSGVQIGTE